MKHVILGAGAVGGLVGAALTHEGDRVLLVRPQTHTQHPGMLRLKRPYDTIAAPVRIETRLAEPVDVLWLAVKARPLVAALRAVPPDVVTTTIVPLLNGIEHVNLLRLRFNHERVVPATILVESERIAPGRIVQRSPFVRLALSTLGEHKLEGVPSRLRHASFSCEFQVRPITRSATLHGSKSASPAPGTTVEVLFSIYVPNASTVSRGANNESNPILLAFFLVNFFDVRMQWPSEDRRRRWRHR
jgi:ketopantoate reductase